MKKLIRLAAVAALGSTLVLSAGAPADATVLAKRHTVTIVASSNGTATVTSVGNEIVQQKDRPGTWRRTFTKQRFTYYSVAVTAFAQDATRVSCRLIVDGEVVRSKHASGDFSSVTCAYLAR